MSYKIRLVMCEGARYRAAVPGDDAASVEEQIVADSEVKVRNGKATHRVVCGHGDWFDVPAERVIECSAEDAEWLRNAPDGKFVQLNDGLDPTSAPFDASSFNETVASQRRLLELVEEQRALIAEKDAEIDRLRKQG